jgi:hypothetical protein
VLPLGCAVYNSALHVFGTGPTNVSVHTFSLYDQGVWSAPAPQSGQPAQWPSAGVGGEWRSEVYNGRVFFVGPAGAYQDLNPKPED